MPALVREAVDFVLDPVRTARTRLAELDNVEKTFIGLKVEHLVRDLLDAPEGLERDLLLCGMEVDVKNTTRANWSIPPETYKKSEPCLLLAIDEEKLTCFAGLFIARRRYLHKGRGNRDRKRGVSTDGFQQILWLVKACPFPPSKFAGLDMERFRELRTDLAGNERAAQFFRENLGRVIHRDVAQSLLFDQRDFMKRLRTSKGAPDILRHEGIAILIGYRIAERKLAAEFGIPDLKSDEIAGVCATNEQQRKRLRAAGLVV